MYVTLIQGCICVIHGDSLNFPSVKNSLSHPRIP